MDAFETYLKEFDGGVVLDVATGRGDFLAYALGGMKSFEKGIGVDNNPDAIEAAKKQYEKHEFQVMDGCTLEFKDNSFDTVCISNSLHHLPKPAEALKEMQRILKPGGRVIIYEMIRDGQTPTQQTHVMLHHWWAEIDSAQGISHNETYSEEELYALIKQADFQEEKLFKLAELSEDPLAEEIQSQLGPVIDRYIERAKGLPNEIQLVEQGEALKIRLKEIGFHGATECVFVGKKL
jgi:ubiquinone/menaquinone biosynthesis C-methylase UbiE